MTTRPRRLYPFLLASVPILHLVANNAGWSRLTDVVVVLSAVLAGCGILYGLAALAARGRWQGRLPPLVVLAAVLWFWGYVQLADVVGSRGDPTTHALLFPLALVVTLGAGWWLLRRPLAYDRVATFLTLTGAMLAGWSALSIVLAELRGARRIARSAAIQRLAQPIPAPPSPAAVPRDIYLLILDGYANAEVTRARYGFDNHVFLDSLRRLGFVVPSVHSNYLHTVLSVPSLLNASHMVGAAREVGSGTDPRLLNYLVEHNRTVRFLKARGYKFALVPSQWWTATRHSRYADIEPRLWGGALEAVLGRSDLRRDLRKASLIDILQRERWWSAADAEYVKRSLAAVEQAGSIPGPVFVFAHIISPHPPFVFNRDCSLVRPPKGSYVDQVQCLNRLVIRLVTDILRESQVPPVIVLQGDHGTKGKAFDQTRSAESMSRAVAWERLGAFGAYYLPAGGAAAFGDSVTVVNVLGNILRYYFGAKLPKEPDDLYLSVVNRPYELKRVDFAWLVQADTTTVRSHAAARGLTTRSPPR